MTPLCSLLAAALVLLFPLLLLAALIDSLTMAPERRIRLYSRRLGYSQRRIADAMGISRYRVRQALA